MGTRLDLHNDLLKICPNAYYQPPATVRMSYPCFLYNLSSIDQRHANNRTYKAFKKYSLTYISKNIADDIVDQVLNAFEYVRFDRHYTADNLHHYTFELYY